MLHRFHLTSGPPRGRRGLRLLAGGLALSCFWACQSTEQASIPEESSLAAGDADTPALDAPGAEAAGLAPAEAATELQEAAEVPRAQPAAAQGKPEKKADPADLALEVEKKVREIDLATLELRVAERKASSEEAAAADAVAAALLEHGAAVRALEHYATIEKAILIAEAQLKVDRSTFRLEDLEQKLEQMIREYGEYETDEHTVETGKIVINRSQKDVEFQQRALDLEIGKRKTLAEFTIPEKIAKLEGEVAKKQSALARAEEALERKRFEAELMVTKAKHKLNLARLEKARAEKKLAQAN